MTCDLSAWSTQPVPPPHPPTPSPGFNLPSVTAFAASLLVTQDNLKVEAYATEKGWDNVQDNVVSTKTASQMFPKEVAHKSWLANPRHQSPWLQGGCCALVSLWAFSD